MSKSWGARAAVLVAGVAMNFFLAFVIFTGLFWSGTSPIAVSPFSDTPTHSFFLPSFSEALDLGFITHSGIALQPMSGSISARAGIESGSLLIAINSVPVSNINSAIAQIQKNQPIIITVRNNGFDHDLSLTPENGKVGMYISYKNLDIAKNLSVQKTGIDGIIAGARETYYSSTLTLSFLGDMLHGLFAPKNQQEHEDAK